MFLSLVIPAHNEEKRIKNTLIRYLDVLLKYDIDFEIIAEMDGCTDRTSEIVRELADEHQEIVVLEFKEKLGKGGGIVKGFENARGDIIGFVDADGSVQPEDLIKLLKMIEGADGVIASRRAKGSVVVNQPFSRKVLSKCFNILVRVLFLLPYRDTQCGAKIFRRKVIEEILPLINTHGFAFDVNLLYLAKKKGFRIVEVGVSWEDKYGSKVKLRKAIPEMLFSVLKLRLYYSPLRFLVD
jgi:glycosyltransferase involved in cell wall biosynthesis